MDKSIMICDADSILYATAFAMKGEPLINLLTKVDDFLISIANSCNAEKALICISEGKSWRKQYAKTKEYKGNRAGREIPPYLDDLKRYLKTKWNAFYIQHWEADDLIFMARTVYKKKYPEYRIFMATNDKDCRQFPGMFLDFKKMAFFTLTPEQASKSLWTQMIVGDSTDNIAGIQGIGKVGAEKMLQDQPVLDYPQVVLRGYIAKYGERAGIEKFYESYKLLKLVDSCEDAGYQDDIIPEPIKVDYSGHSELSETSSQDSPQAI